MINVYINFETKRLLVWVLVIDIYSILGLIVKYKISLWVCVLVVLTNPNLAINFNKYVQIEIFDSLNYFD